jgi:hypothetical protein
MAITYNDAEAKITSTGHLVLQHLVTGLRYKGYIDYRKHIDAASVWVFGIQEVRIHPDNRRATEIEFYKWLWQDHEGLTLESFAGYVKKLDALYFSAVTENFNLEETHKFLENLYEDMATKLATGKFAGLQFYLPKDMR